MAIGVVGRPDVLTEVVRATDRDQRPDVRKAWAGLVGARKEGVEGHDASEGVGDDVDLVVDHIGLPREVLKRVGYLPTKRPHRLTLVDVVEQTVQLHSGVGQELDAFGLPDAKPR